MDTFRGVILLHSDGLSVEGRKKTRNMGRRDQTEIVTDSWSTGRETRLKDGKVQTGQEEERRLLEREREAAVQWIFFFFPGVSVSHVTSETLTIGASNAAPNVTHRNTNPVFHHASEHLHSHLLWCVCNLGEAQIDVGDLERKVRFLLETLECSLPLFFSILLLPCDSTVAIFIPFFPDFFLLVFI